MRMPEAVHEDDTLTFPIKGKDGKTRDYTIQPCDIDAWRKASKLGLTMIEVMAGRSGLDDIGALLTDSPEATWAMVLGQETFDAMRADGVGVNDFRRAFATVCIWYGTGMDNEIAAASWLGKAPSPKTPSAKTGGAASRTPTASTSGTSTPKASTPKKPKARRGGRSGSTTTSSKRSSTSDTGSTSTG